jgi:hypothetical protein
MKNIYKKIQEAKDLDIYKKLLNVLGDYSTNVPATGVDGLFNIAIEQGKKVLPDDKQGLAILDFILTNNSTPAAVQKLLNMRFSDLPTDLRPMIKVGRKHEVAFYTRAAVTSDRVKDLIDWEEAGKKGQWTNLDGETAQLLDLTKEEK